FESDFTAFLKPDVDANLKRAALKQLFRDPRFNVMDGLDTYIDDYTKADPIPPEMLAGLLKRFGNLPEAEPPPVVAADERDPAAAPERSAGEGEATRPHDGIQDAASPQLPLSPTSGADQEPAVHSAAEAEDIASGNH